MTTNRKSTGRAVRLLAGLCVAVMPLAGITACSSAGAAGSSAGASASSSASGPASGVSSTGSSSGASSSASGATNSAGSTSTPGDASTSSTSGNSGSAVGKFRLANPANITVSVPSLQLLELAPLGVALDQGYFKDENLNVTVQEFPQGGSASAQALLAGRAQIAVQGILQAIRGRAKDQPVSVVGAVSNITYAIAVKKGSGIKSVSDLKGKIVGISSPGSGTEAFLSAVLQKNGVAPSDVKMIPVGQTQSLLAALQHGSVVAAITNPPMTTIVQKQGIATILLDGTDQSTAQATFGGSVPWDAVLVEKTWGGSHGQEIKAFLEAITRAKQLIGSTPESGLAKILPKEAQKGDVPTEVQGWLDARSALAESLAVSDDDYQRVVNLDATITPTTKAAQEAGKLATDKVLNMSYAKAVDAANS